MEKLTIRELFAFKASVYALSKFNVNPYDIKVLTEKLDLVIKDTFRIQLEEASSSNSLEAKNITDAFVKASNEYISHINWINERRSEEIEMMTS